MKKLIVGFLFLMLLSCVNRVANLNGDWQQIFLGYEGENNIEGYVTDSAIIHLNLFKNQKIEFDYRDGFDNDLADSIFFKYPQLNFRKLNYNQKYNRFSMNYDQTCDCFNGLFKSHNGNRVKVKWVRRVLDN